MMTTITAVELIIIAIFALVTIFGISWGIKRKRERLTSEATTNEHREAMLGSVPDAAPATAVVTPPVTPSPPPIVDAPVVVATPPLVDEPSSVGDPPIADEPIVAAAAFDASPATLAADMVANTPVPEPLAGDITQLKGLGPKLAAQLAELGITRVDQIAAMSTTEIEQLDAKLGAFKGRIARVLEAQLVAVACGAPASTR